MREINESYQKHSQANDKFYELHKRFARLTQFVAKGTVISYTGYSSLMVLVQPTIGSYFALGHLTPCMQVYFIGVREYSDFLMNILIVYNLLMFVIIFINYCAVDLLIYATLANIPLLSTIFENDMKEYECELEANRLSSGDILERYKTIILLNRKYIE